MRTKKIVVEVVKETKKVMVISDRDIVVSDITPKTIGLNWGGFDNSKFRVSKRVVVTLLEYIESGKLETLVNTPGLKPVFSNTSKVKAGSTLTIIEDANIDKRGEGYEGHIYFTAEEIESSKLIQYVEYRGHYVESYKNNVRIGCVEITKAELEDVIEEMEKL
ncbi:hypothetical protein LCGC14_1159950 [marine sediment metagenome]|uniref:Uncharacterized protein n=1 Tax=marine sediment metagenome TaxID=412755 RepID=A0A0F9LSV6_9ZZZZ